MTLEKLPVLFRASRTKDAEVTAVFPTLPHDATGRYLTCYAHVGQHGGCDHGFIHRTRKAKPEEYGDLLIELRGIYGVPHWEGDEAYELVVYQRTQPAHRKAFRAEVERLRRMDR